MCEVTLGPFEISIGFPLCGSIEPCVSKVLVDLDGLIVIGQCAFEIVNELTSRAAITPSFDKLGFEVNRPSLITNRTIEIAQPESRYAAIIISFGLAWFELDGTVEIGKCRLIVAFIFTCDATIVPGDSKPRIEFDHFVTVVYCAIKVAQLNQRDAAVHVSINEARIKLNGTSEVLKRVHVII